MIVTRYDFIEVKATVTGEGWIRDRPIVTRAGIFEYRNINGTTKKEYRPEDEVFHQDSMASLSGIPITNGHLGIVTSRNVKGILGTVLGPGERQESNLIANIIIHDPEKLNGRKELSLGYTADIDEKPGTWNGQHYDAIQKNIRYNHLAVVNKGRSGNARLRLDAADAVQGIFSLEGNMSGETHSPKLVSFRLDEIEYHASPEVIRHVNKLNEQITDHKKRFDSLEAERDNLKKKIEDHEKELKKVREDAAEGIRERMTLEETAKKRGVEAKSEDTDRKIKEGVITKLRGATIKFDGKSDDYVASAFDLAIADAVEKEKKVGNQREMVTGVTKTNAKEPVMGSVTARQRMLDRTYRPDQKKSA